MRISISISISICISVCISISTSDNVTVLVLVPGGTMMIIRCDIIIARKGSNAISMSISMSISISISMIISITYQYCMSSHYHDGLLFGIIMEVKTP